MEVEFKNARLRKRYEDFGKARKAYGDEVARRYIQRIGIIKQARDIEELESLPALRCERLKGNLKGLWSLRLTGFYRLIFSLAGGRLDIVRIEEVSKHYGD